MTGGVVVVVETVVVVVVVVGWSGCRNGGGSRDNGACEECSKAQGKTWKTRGYAITRDKLLVVSRARFPIIVMKRRPW